MKFINELANKYQLKVVYDAAHCFGVEQDDVSVCNFGDMSVLSFQATKVFNTIEGGAIVWHDKQYKERIDALKNAGKIPGYQLSGYGLNAKMNEVQAAYGLVLLKYIDEIIEKRKIAADRYSDLLNNVRGIRLFQKKVNVAYNYSYFPVLIDEHEFGVRRDELVEFLEKCNIITKKYFHPLVSDYEGFRIYKSGNLSVARKIANNVICLPLFHDITIDEQNAVVETILKSHGAIVRSL